ncbi:MAG: Ig-like domain-containing protein [Myxococcota bacterium]
MTHGCLTLQRALLFLTCLSLAACGDACDEDVRDVVTDGADMDDMRGVDMSTPEAEVARVELSSPTESDNLSTLELGDTLQLDVIVYDALDNILQGREVRWAITPTQGVVTVDEDAVVTGVGEGVVAIRARVGGVASNEIGVRVTPLGPDRVLVMPGMVSIKRGDTEQLTARVVDKRDAELPNVVVSWSSADGSVAVVNSSGLLEARAVGQTTITASTINPEGFRGSVTVLVDERDVASVEIADASPLVLEVDQTFTLTASALDDRNMEIPGRMFAWSSSMESVATVDPNTGEVTAVAPGTTDILAANESASDTITVQVVPKPVAEIDLLPSSLALTVGETFSGLSATPRAADGQMLPGRPIAWRSNDTSVVTLTTDPTDDTVVEVTAANPGTTRVFASAESIERSILVTVSPAVGQVTVTPDPVTLLVGDVQQFSVDIRDTQGNPLPRPVVWTTDDLTASIVTINAQGELTARGVGMVEVRATVDGVTGTAQVEVQPTPVDSVTVRPAVVALFPTQQTTVTPTLFDADSNVLTGRAVTWSTSAPSIATVDSSGVITAVAQGRAVVTAASEGKTAEVEVVVAVKFRHIEPGGSQTCGITLGTNTNYCWGRDQFGSLGNGSMRGDASVADPVSGTHDFATISSRAIHNCGLTASAKILCWGFNGSGQLGNNSSLNAQVPQQISSVLNFVSVSAGGTHTCAIGGATGDITYCWGDNRSGQIGADSMNNTEKLPTPVSGTVVFRDVYAGGEHTCAIRDSDSSVYCWGRGNYLGITGLTSNDLERVPQAITSTEKFDMLDAGAKHTCGVTDKDDIFCWGTNADGQLGDGTQVDRQTPAQVSGTQAWDIVAVGSDHTCALTLAGKAYCWGANNNGQRGDGGQNTNSLLTPQIVADNHTFKTLAAGRSHTCAIDTDDIAYCWGENFRGKLGDGTTLDRFSPFPVVVP